MRRSERLRSRRDFATVYRRGRPYRSDLLIMRVFETEAAHSRFGFAVGKPIGTAVVRNKVKRRLREAVRSFAVGPGWDVVLTARKGSERASYAALREAIGALFGRAGLLASEGDA